MARKRMIDPKIWSSEDFSEMSYFSRLVWIGLFSNADDEGRGKANYAYIKSQIFPFDEDLSIKKIEASLKEIEKSMSIEFYQVDGKRYYQLLNWERFQTINRPSPSQIPLKMGSFEKKISEQSMNNQGMFNEQSLNNQQAISEQSVPKKEIEIEDINIERKSEERKPHAGFIKPTLEDVRDYAKSRNSIVDPVKFFEFYEAGDWKDSKGQNVKNWKQKFITWENKEGARKEQTQSPLFKAAERLGV